MSSSISSSSDVEAILKSKRELQEKPTNDVLQPVYRFLVPQVDGGSTSTTTHEDHWYCSKAVSPLHREAATYLIFLFAFQRQGTSKLWVEKVEMILESCEQCARGFGAARRRMESKYLSDWPLHVRKNFFGAVDRWQSGFIAAQVKKATDPAYGKEPPTGPSLYALGRPALQVLMGEPSLLSHSNIVPLIDDALSTPPPASLSALGMTPVHARLLSSTELSKREWCLALLPAAARRPLSFTEWCSLGIGSELQDLYNDGSLDGETRWTVMKTVIDSKVLDKETVERGLLKGQLEDEPHGRTGRGLMPVLSGLISSDTTYLSSVLSCFHSLLHSTPTHLIWAFDTSPDLPHTLLSELRANPALQSLFEARFKTENAEIEDTAPSSADKGKGKAREDGPLDWMGDFLLSVLDSDKQRSSPAKGSLAFTEALAIAMNMVFQEFQHPRLPEGLRAFAAYAGFDALIRVYQAVGPGNTPYNTAISSVLDLHSGFITTVAFRPQHQSLRAWSETRSAAREVLMTFFSADATSTISSVIALAMISYDERKRLQRKKREKSEKAPPPRYIDKLPQAVVRKDLWAMAYDALSPTDSEGAAILLKSLVPFAHVELLDRQASWTHHGLEEVVKKDDWVTAIRSINAAIRSTRESFPRVIESLASQADPRVVESLWKIEGIPKTMTILLLSPDDDIHTPVISIIQQSFEDVDDRGDCFRALLKTYPNETVDGLSDFLRTFFEAANVTPESCSLAKWLVRCFHDVLEVLCGPSELSVPLLQSDSFLSSYSNGRAMTKRLEELWHLMTTSLALIFKRTLDWAPHFENEVMVDWMRDALIFGRQMTDHIRAFEAAVLGTNARSSGTLSESTARTSLVGKKMTKQLELILADLILWLRLTDVETLFQTHQLIKTILDRINKTSTDLSKNPTLERTLVDIDKFCRKTTRSFTSRLTDDSLSELSELLEPFNLAEDEPEIQFVRETKPPSSGTKDAKPAALRNAFSEMMKASGSKSASSSRASTPSEKRKESAGKSKDTGDEVDDDDDFFDLLSPSDLDLIEKRAVMKNKVTQTSSKLGPSSLQSSARALPPSHKIHVDLRSKYPPTKPTSSSTFKSKFMKDLRKEHAASIHERKTDLGQSAPRLPTASVLGSGLGAYTGPPKARVVEPADSGSSASESSDDERSALKNLAAKQKSPARPARPAPEKRSIKVLADPMNDVLRRNEDRRAKAHATKMRLKPDYNPLYRYVLSWDPDHAGPLPPHGAKFAAALSKLQPVPSSFRDAKHYEQIMLPLYLQELWAQCAKDQAQTGPAIEAEIMSRQYEDDFVDIEFMVSGRGDFWCNDSDLVTLRQPGNPKGIFAKVMFFKKQMKASSIRARIMASMDVKELCGKSKWQIRKHFSLGTAIREFGALKGLPWYESTLLTEAMAGRSARLPQPSSNDIEDAMQSFGLNQPQARAVVSSMQGKGFALIQGPPGTGKTKTISGLVGKWLSERSIPISTNGQPVVKPKLLVCAPSNAAIDEVCKRLILGVPNPEGGTFSPNIVRVGIDTSVNIAVKDVSLDSLVEAKINTNSNTQAGGDYARIQAELDDVKQQIKDKQEAIRLAEGHDEKRGTLENEYHALITRRTQLGQASSKAKDAARDSTRHLDGARRAARERVMNDADIVCATLSGAGHETLSAYTFGTVIIDEAAQAIEMSCLIPLKYGCTRCVMVGDPNQLPPTTFSTNAEKMNYNESLFVRLSKRNAESVQLLSIQYRMNPFISELPSKVFYNGQLRDGPDMAKKTAAIWHERNVFGPYRFFNIQGTEKKVGTSTKNTEEAMAAVELYGRLNADFGTRINLAMRVGVISMYKEQLRELKKQFIEAFGPAIVELVEFNTVDGFQGQEKDIIILSCVRSGPDLHHIGFLRDVRRMNVALTRAKSSLFVFGNGPTLERSDDRWKIIVQDARERGFFIDYTPTIFSETIHPPPPKHKKRSSVPKTISSPSKRAEASSPALLPPKALAAEISGSPQARKRVAENDSGPDKKKRRKLSDAGSPTSTTRPWVKPEPTPMRELPKPSTSSSSDKPHKLHKVVGTTGTSSLDRPQQLTKPRPPPATAPEDVLFIKKKKKVRRFYVSS
ncbi:hypothetical protein I350_02898 [Cryptococcus amylolentus CBS 6273]|uniref:Senataxin n=1 Tax=Cryptococcus amylolentus CBS 6273 TaxID=1296118 RepID=A0A1E3K7X4_9TREE|nr:hypothetical protein I350_02898 [Cryptococcus amylolentus CBS 6273]